MSTPTREVQITATRVPLGSGAGPSAAAGSHGNS